MRYKRSGTGVGGLLLVVLAGLVALAFGNRRSLAAFAGDVAREDEPRPEPADADPGPTRAELYRAAQRLDIVGRSRMSKSELETAVRRLS